VVGYAANTEDSVMGQLLEDYEKAVRERHRAEQAQKAAKAEQNHWHHRPLTLGVATKAIALIIAIVCGYFYIDWWVKNAADQRANERYLLSTGSYVKDPKTGGIRAKTGEEISAELAAEKKVREDRFNLEFNDYVKDPESGRVRPETPEERQRRKHIEATQP
jgi:hypothetical protein